MRFQYVHHDLGYREAGDVVEVALSAGAFVRLMDSSNFSNYRNGHGYRFIGGLAKVSPLRLEIPTAGHWSVAVDMQGLRGSAHSSARILTAA